MLYHGAKIINGKLKLNNKDKFKGLIASQEDGPVVLVVMNMNEKDVRSCQNRYFAQLGEWSNSVGERKEFLHDLVKEELFVNLFGEALSTTELTSEQWTMVFFNLENFLIRKYENK